jgi:glycosyltransferase involved in cell wall biosynthesis
MQYPTINQLPAAPGGKTGWPWTESSTGGPQMLPDRCQWPRVTIVTPSYNQGEFLEETVRSVLLQGYPDLEFIVIDGGSTDNSVEIIRKYEKWLTYWVSEKDHGQAHAINKGLEHASGEICAYLNSDDVYLPNALHNIVAFFDKDSEATVAYGDCQIIDESSRLIDLWLAPEFDPIELLFRCYIPQPATFWRQSAELVGNFNQEMHFAFDYEMWLRMAAARQEFSHLPLLLAQHRKAEGTKTVSKPESFAGERITALKEFFDSPVLSAARRVESDSYAIVFLNQALLNFRLARLEDAQRALEDAFRQSPKLVATQRERTIRALVDFADPSGPLGDSREFLRLVFAELPEAARELLQLRASVLRRVEILHAARSKDLQAPRRARRLLLPILLDDYPWIRNRAVRSEILKVLIGEAAIRRLAAFKLLLKTARNAFPRTRKNYA